MADDNSAFLTEGISLGIPNDSVTDITTIDNAIFIDSLGKLNFKDKYVESLVDENGDPITSLKLEDLVLRVKGIYVQNGKLYFKDSTINRAYSLKEIIESYINWKEKLSTGGIYWIGNTKITNNDCNNIIINKDGDPTLAINTPISQGTCRIFTKSQILNDYPTDATGTKVFSIDEYLNNLDDYDSNLTPLGYAYTNEGALRWHDIPNVSLILPPLDENKSIMLMAKINIRLLGSSSPILIRMYDKTTGIELDRKTIMNDSKLPMEQQPILTYVGKMPQYLNNINKLSCACASENEKVMLQNEPTRNIAIQFNTIEKLDQTDYILDENDNIIFDGLERRIFGIPNEISDTPIVNMGIDAIIYDISNADTIGRKSGTVSFQNKDIVEIVFEKPFTGSDYSVSLSCGKNINVWYSNKKPSGFFIRSEIKMTGNIDWVATKLKYEGEA